MKTSVLAQVPLNTKRSNNWAASTWEAWAIGHNSESSTELVNLDFANVTDDDLSVWIPCFVWRCGISTVSVTHPSKKMKQEEDPQESKPGATSWQGMQSCLAPMEACRVSL